MLLSLALAGCGFTLEDDWTLEVSDGAVIETPPHEWANPMRCTITASGEEVELACDGRPSVRLRDNHAGALRNAVRAVEWDTLVVTRREDVLEGGGFRSAHLTSGGFDRTWNLSNSRNRALHELMREIARVRREIAEPGARCASDAACHWGYCEERRCVTSPCDGDDGTTADGPGRRSCDEELLGIRSGAWRCIDRRTCDVSDPR
jgi:hypothetical protein